MTLRESLVGDARRVHEQIDTLLDSQDGLLLLFDGARMVSYKGSAHRRVSSSYSGGSSASASGRPRNPQ